MEALIAFLFAFGFSFVGSIPPATINLSAIQLGLENKLKIAWRFSIAAALMEYPYAWLAVKFENWITASPMVVHNFQLITAVVMITLGTLNILSVNKPSKLSQKLHNSGFRRGLVLGMLNPLAMPFWIGVTAYLESQQWINISTHFRLHSYLLGVTCGAFTFLILAAHLAKRITIQFQQSAWLKNLPGVCMLVLGIYALIKYLL